MKLFGRLNKILLLILVLALALRLIGLSSLPAGFTPDETSFGYDAYSIIRTGRDQWGHKLPLVLESFGDFKTPLYSYLTIPSILIFGLNKFATRLPNALLGTAAVLVTYLLVRELRKLSHKNLESRVWNLEFIASLLLAISPWHIMMSRGAFEANLTTLFMPLGVYLFLKGLKKIEFLSWSSLVFGLNLFSYHSAKLVTPLIVFFLLAIFRKQMTTIPIKKILWAIIIFGVFGILTINTLLLGAGRRVAERSIFQGALQEASVARFASIQGGLPPFIARLLHNKYQVTVKRFLDNYGHYFSAKFLFKNGPVETTYGMIPGRGVLYWIELPLLFGFLITVIKKKSRELLIILIWIILAPIPAALSTGVGYAANRAVIMLPALMMAEAYGAFYLFEILGKILANNTKWIVIGYLLIMFLFLFSFIKDYLVSYLKTAEGMLSGNLEVAYWLRENTNVSEEILMSRKLSEPQIYLAFAYKWDPTDFQKATLNWNYKESNLGWVDQLPEYRLGNYSFGSIDWNKDSERYTYLVGRPDEFPKSVTPTKVLTYPDGKPSIFIVSQKPRYAQKIY